MGTQKDWKRLRNVEAQVLVLMNDETEFQTNLKSKAHSIVEKKAKELQRKGMVTVI